MKTKEINIEEKCSGYNMQKLFTKLNDEAYYNKIYSLAMPKYNCPEEFEYYVENYHEYIKELVDYADYFFIDEMKNEEDMLILFKENFDFETFSEIMDKKTGRKYFANNIFNIKSLEDKNKYKELFTMNIEDEFDEHVELAVKKDYFDNSGKYYFNTYFLKDDNLIAIFYNYNGDIADFRDEKIIEKQISKYKNK